MQDVVCVREEKGIIFVLGERRIEFLNNIVTNTVSQDSPVTHAAFLSRLGKMIALCTVYALPKALIIVTDNVCLPRIMDALSTARLMKITILERSNEFIFYTIFGSKRNEATTKLAGVFPKTIAEEKGTIIINHNNTIDIITPTPLPIEETSDDIKELFRIGQGFPAWGKEMDETTSFPDLGLEYTVSYTKGCYVGQEIVSRVKNIGQPPKLLRQLVIDGEEIPPFRTPIIAEAQIGYITSAAYSSSLKKIVALGFVQKSHYAPGTKVSVLGKKAVVNALPEHQC